MKHSIGSWGASGPQSGPQTPRPHFGLAWGLVVALMVMVSGVGCEPQASPCGDPPCDGSAAPLCVDRACAEGARCVLGACSPSCSRATDCSTSEVCAEMYTDYGTQGAFCIDLTGAPRAPGRQTDEPDEPDEPAQTGEQCQEDADCPSTRVEHCIDGTCRVGCQVHAHCGSAGACTGQGETADGQVVKLCEPDGVLRGPGQFDSSCLNGTADCAADFYCISAGEGDVDSYCTRNGCKDDPDCPLGYYCDHRRLRSTPPCESVCGLEGEPGNPECIPAANVGAGQAFQCADTGLELTQCLRKEFCAPCEQNADCAAIPGQICAVGTTGVKQCTQLCDPNSPSCPWGSATTCGLWDAELGLPTCAHRAGACQQSGSSCEPCLDDRDCPSGFCTASLHSRERYCYDSRPSCECSSDESSCAGGGCPETPGGLAMTCYPDVRGLEQNSCFSAAIDPSDAASRQGCWPDTGQ